MNLYNKFKEDVEKFKESVLSEDYSSSSVTIQLLEERIIPDCIKQSYLNAIDCMIEEVDKHSMCAKSYTYLQEQRAKILNYGDN